MTRLTIVPAGLTLLLLTGCTVGPKYTKPDFPTPPAFKEADGWKTAQPGDQGPRGTWWGSLQRSTPEHAGAAIGRQ